MPSVNKIAINFIKKYRWDSIFVKNFKKSLLIIIIPFLIITVIISIYFQMKIEMQDTSSATISTNQTLAAIDNLFSTLENQQKRFTANQYIKIAAVSTNIFNQNNIHSFNAMNKVNELMGDVRVNNLFISAVDFYSMGSKYVFSTSKSGYLGSFEHLGWYDKYMELQSPNFIIHANNDLIYLCRGIYNSSEICGILIFELDFRSFINSLKNQNLSEIILMDNNKNLIFSFNNNSLIIDNTKLDFFENAKDTSAIKSGSNLYISKRLYNNNITCITSTKLISQITQNKTIFIVVLICLLSSLIVALLFSFYLSLQFYYVIADIMLQIDVDKNSVNGPIESINEMIYIEKSIINFIQQNKNIEQELTKKMILLKKAQHLALQSQINPHFIFNSLNLINLKVLNITKKDSDINIMISLLSDLLSYTLDSKSYLVKISEEIEYAKKYIEMILIRYNHSFYVNWNIDDRISDYYMIKIILQPIIENAFLHGISEHLDSEKQCIITISAHESQTGNIKFTITDNGSGMTFETLTKLQNTLLSEDVTGNNHIGLFNVNQRIKLFYGEDYGAKITSDQSGTIVTIIFPKRTVNS